mmetsp:Transcript_26992/g.58755  ORF Transcript_26992/g.58755 Transcript_26992/m.58755 type:complete len:184 (-) Transcript_26992:277-828(-)
MADRFVTSNSAYGSFYKAIPLEPKINSAPPPPETDATHIGRERVARRKEGNLAKLLRSQNLREKEVLGDGNCQFRALADQLYGQEDHHQTVRGLVIQQLEAGAEHYHGFVPGRYSDYLKAMARSGTWGDHVTLQAAADILGVRINVLTDYITDGFIEVIPQQQKSEKILKITFWQEVHYNSVQ